jgi:hypothetical protein
MGVLSLLEFRDELIKRGSSITDTGAVAEYGIESSGITIVQQSDLLIA